MLPRAMAKAVTGDWESIWQASAGGRKTVGGQLGARLKAGATELTGTLKAKGYPAPTPSPTNCSPCRPHPLQQ